jgi:hypothetical protein
MQARYTAGILSGKYKLPVDLKEGQAKEWKQLCAEYSTINTENVYPVEQFNYCDMLAREMDILPTRRKVGSLRTWLGIMLSPISTLHYMDEYFDPQSIDGQKVYMPPIVVAFLAFMRVLGYPFRARRNLQG